MLFFSESKPGLRLLEDQPFKYFPSYAQYVFVVQTAWVGSNQENVVNILRALLQAVEWLQAERNREESIQLLASRGKTTREVASRVYDFVIRDAKALLTNLALSREGLLTVAKFSGQLAARKISIENLVDDSYRQRAAKR